MSTSVSDAIPGAGLNPERMPGHLLLAQLGKRVLRPGGIGLTRRLLGMAQIGEGDRVVELAPGVGATARLVVAARPASYTGVDRDAMAAALTETFLEAGADQRCIVASAEATTLPDECATVVIGEAMLTMQREQRKREIVAEAWRLLEPGGRYVIHELSLVPDDLDPAVENDLCATLSETIHVGARPLTVAAWKQLLAAQGFVVVGQAAAAMGLLHPSRVVRDEGFGALRIAFNLLRRPQARRRVLAMRRTFRRHRDHLSSIGLVAVKPR